MLGSIKPGTRIGIVVDAGPRLGYGHAVRCLRLAERLSVFASVAFYPLSEACSQFLKSVRPETDIRTPNSEFFPPVVITDLRETHGITAAIHRSGACHISIHDLGLGQCHSNIAIDGSVVQLFPFHKDKTQALFVGPSYMMTRPAVPRKPPQDFVFLTLGGGFSAELAPQIQEMLDPLGLKIVTTHGFGPGTATSDEEISKAMSCCRFAISTAGTSLYDLLGSGVPTIALSVDRLQLRTAEAFHELGAVLSAGLINRLSSKTLADHIQELVGNASVAQRMVAAGKKLVDGKGLSRVTEIIRAANKESAVSDREYSEVLTYG